MSLYAIAAAAIALTVVAQIGLLGKIAGQSSVTPSKVLVALLPSVAIAGAAGFHHGFTLTWAVVAILAILIGAVVSVYLGPPSESKAGVATRGLESAIAYAILLVIGALFVSWIASTIAAFSTLNYWVVVVFIVVAGAAVAFGRGSSRGLAKTAAIIFCVVAVLMLVVGVVGGSFQFLGDPVIFYNQVGFGQILIYGLAVLVVTALNPGLREMGGTSRPAVIRGAIITAVFTFLGYLGLLLLFGGAIQLPSVPMHTVVAYVPPVLAAIFIALLSIVGAVGAAAVLGNAVSQSRSVTESAYHIKRRDLAVGGHFIFAAIVLALLASAALRPEILIPLGALLAIAGFIIGMVSRRRHGIADATAETPTQEVAA
ncbi:MAG: hypothetical protein WAS05_06620 [Candidatus Nanopelagicales bacterium]